jgi:hypothetical protein
MALGSRLRDPGWSHHPLEMAGRHKGGGASKLEPALPAYSVFDVGRSALAVSLFVFVVPIPGSQIRKRIPLHNCPTGSLLLNQLRNESCPASLMRRT